MDGSQLPALAECMDPGCGYRPPGGMSGVDGRVHAGPTAVLGVCRGGYRWPDAWSGISQRWVVVATLLHVVAQAAL